MLLGVILMFCFEIWSDFGEKSQKYKNWKNLGIIKLLCRSVRNPHRGLDLRQGVGYSLRGEAEVPKLVPLEYAKA